MARVITVASGKGGTGKTSFCAGVASALSNLGCKILLIDGDSGLRNLDIVLCMTDKVVFSFSDVALKVVDLDRAIVQHDKLTNLYMLTSPHDSLSDDITPSGMLRIINQANMLLFDYVFIDCPAGITRELELFCGVSSEALIVSTLDHTCLRGAEHTSRVIERYGVCDIKLAINRIRPKLVKNNCAANIDDAMDTTGLTLLGIIPEDENVIICANLGIPVVSYKNSSASLAYKNIAKRLLKKKVPLIKLD